MRKNPVIPDGWSMPDDLARKISEALNKKSITPENELAYAQDEMARDIALIEPNPQDWAGWVIYLLEQMEEEDQKRLKETNFENTLRTLLNELTERIKSGKW